MSVELKHGIVLAISIGIICLLIAPSAGLNSVYSGKIFDAQLVIHALTGLLWLLLVSGAHPMKMAGGSRHDVLDRTCVRLC